MSSLVGLQELRIEPGDALVSQKCTDCAEARRGCMPTFVFSVEGQVTFRSALDHIVNCRKQDCADLRTLVLHGMQSKLKMLFSEEAMLGCVHVQPSIYGSRSVRLKKQNFTAVAQHLAHCPKESCARLRRSLMLSVRDSVSPNAQLRS